MRKIDDTKLQEMLQEGKSQREIARFFRVSDAAVSKRLKRLAGEEPPESFTALAPKEQKFVLAKMQGKSNTQAAVEAYDVGSIESAKTIGARLSKDPDVERAISDLLHEEGIGRRRQVQILRNICEAKDLGIAARGIDMAFKLTGEYAPEKNLNVVIYSDLERGLAELQAESETLRKELGLPPAGGAVQD